MKLEPRNLGENIVRANAAQEQPNIIEDGDPSQTLSPPKHAQPTREDPWALFHLNESQDKLV